MTAAYGWTPAEIGGLTLYQACMYLGAYTPEDGAVRMSPDAARRFQRGRSNA